MRFFRKRFWCILLAVMMIWVGFAGSSVSAASVGKQITIIPNSDVQPFIRQYLPKSLFGSGGPFTISMQVKIEDFKKTKVGGLVLVDIWDGRVESKGSIGLFNYTKSTDWIDVKMTSIVETHNIGLKEGDPITFDNVKGIWLNGALQDYYLLDMGMLWATGTVTFRNFEVKNAAGEVVYSWAEEEDLQGVSNVADIENPEPLIMKSSFGDSSGQLLVSDADASTPVVTTIPPAYEEPTSPPDTPDATTAPPKSTTPDGPTTAPASEDPSSGTDPASDTATTSPLQGDGSSAGDADSSSAAVAGNPESDGDAGEKSSFSIWIPIGIVAGVLVAAGVVLLVLWKLKKLPWIKE